MSIDVNVQNDLVIVTESSEDIVVNVSNAAGPAGPAGVGVPVGGSTGQVLKKLSATNYDTYWALDGGGVPYSGATGDVDLGEYELKAGQVEFDQTPTGAIGAAVMRWNDSDGTVDLGLKGGNVTLQVGQEQVLRVVNKTGADLLESQYRAVRIRLVSEGGSQGQRLAVVLAQGDNDPDSTTTIGIVTENIDNNQEGFITTSGEVRGINTTGSLQGETWVDGDIIYLSPTIPGGITKVKPTAPQHLLQLGYVIYAHNVNGKIFVKIDNGYELSELHDVYAPSPTDGQGIFWNTANLRYQNNTVAGILGYTPVPTTRTLTINGSAYDLSADRSWTVSGTNIYTADGTLSADRIVDGGGFSLRLNPILIQGATFRGYVNKSIVSGYGTTSSFNNILASDTDVTYTGSAFTDLYGTYHSAYITNSGAGGSNLVRARGYYAELATRGQTASSNISLIGFDSYVVRRDSSDISTNANNTIYGYNTLVGHVFSSDASIYTSIVSASNNNITNNSGTMNVAYGNLQNITLSTTSNSKNSLVTNYYAFYSSATVGRASGPTGTVTNYYGLYFNTPTVAATGTITNRWGVYAPDVAMSHYINGKLLLGLTTPSTFLLDVNGTARVSGDTLISGVFQETVTTNRQAASYTLALTDRGKLVEMNVAGANNLTVPLNSVIAFPIGTKVDLSQYGAGQTTVVATGGVTVRSAGGALKLALQYSGASLVKIGTDEWYLFGDITV